MIKCNIAMSYPRRLIHALRDRELDMASRRAQMTDGEPDLKTEILFRDRIEIVVAKPSSCPAPKPRTV